MASTDTAGASRKDDIAVLPLTEQDISGAVRCIQQAFGDGDPYHDWAFDQRSFSADRNYQSLRARCLWGMRNAIFLVAKSTAATNTSNAHTHNASTSTASPANSTTSNDGEVLGLAMWLPPRRADAPQTWSEWWDGWVLWARQVAYNTRYGRGGLNVKRYYIWKSAQQTSHTTLWTDPHGYYFCNLVGVLPTAQGKGIGGMLFRHVLDRADDEGRKCYLESSRDVPNTIIYEKMGFRKVKEMVCRDDEVGEEGLREPRECKLYCMIRDPKPKSQP